ncbi:MAG: DUF2929 family protein [Bavariicoccus seileri]|uniref:DUF2929 domain-containing protein n=1 Tax=Bavariicoccus seileri TaxID=549685 RepID=A0A3D4S372_9ENTE|nr:DUF2929 family protein [Bavariicoccus seileri]HCS93200.1 DUF2929 domain-containing protein [Bavariicoccus seileri]
MKYIITGIWAFILTQMTFFLGSALMNSKYSFLSACLTAVIELVLVVLISDMLKFSNHLKISEDTPEVSDSNSTTE